MSKKKLFTFLKKRYFLFFTLIFVGYSCLLIFRSSFVIDSTRYFSLFDDEMISMRYAYNLAHGYGLIWNPGGERIEGITNPLWTLYMSVIHLLPISIEKTSLIIQSTGLIAYIVTLYYVKRIAHLLSRGSTFVVFLSVLFTAFYFPLINWSIIQGTEVSVLTLILTVSTFLLLRSLNSKKNSNLFFILLGLGVWVRLDFIIPAVVLVCLLIVFNKKQRKNILIKGIPLLSLFLIVQVVLRYWYYQDFLPNTYYLKMTGYPILNRIIRGIYVTFKEFNLVVLAIPFVYLFLSRSREVCILLTLFVTQLFYSIYVGGDAWEFFGGANRYISLAIPLFFIALILTFNTVRIAIKKHYPQHARKSKIAGVFCIVLIFFILNTASDNMLLYLSMVKQFPTVAENENQLKIAKDLESFTNRDATIGIVIAGVTPYFLPERTFIDLLGKSDKVIARLQATKDPNLGRLQQYIHYRPGHNKWDYSYVVNHYKPDIFSDVFPSSEYKYLKNQYEISRSQQGYIYYVKK